MAPTLNAPPPPEPLGVLRGHRVPVNTSSFLAPSALVSGGADGAVKIWDLRSRREAATASSAHSKAGVLHAAVLGAASGPDAVSSRFVTQGRDGLVKVWDTESFREGAAPLLSYYCGSYSFTKFAALRWPSGSDSTESPLTSDASAGENLIVCPGAEGNQIYVYDCRDAAGRAAMHIDIPDSRGQGKRGMCMSLSLFESTGAASDSGSRQLFIGAGFESGQLAVLDLRSGGQVACEAQITSETNPLLAFDVTRDGRSAICGSSGEELFLAEFDASALAISSREFFRCNHGGISAIRVRSDQRIFATAGWDHRVRVFHLRKLKPLAILKHHTESVFGLDFSPDSALLASVSKDHKIALWSIYPPTPAAASQRHLRPY